MFLTGLNVHQIIRREPALADFDPSYATNFPDRLNEAKAVIDNRLRASGYDLEKIGIKTDVWNFDNADDATISVTLTDCKASQNLLVIIPKESIEDAIIRVAGANGNIILNDSTTGITAGVPVSVILPYSESTMTFSILGTAIEANSLKVYLTDTAVYFVHLYKTLHLIYESFKADPGDLFEQKAETYRMAYENEFNTMVTYYDRNGDGTTDETDGQKPVKQVRFKR